MSKTEERLKITIKEYMEDKNREISSNIITIFLWGFSFGMIFAYANIAQLIIGMVFGYFLAKKNIPFIDYFIQKFVSYIDFNKLNKMNNIKNIKFNESNSESDELNK